MDRNRCAPRLLPGSLHRCRVSPGLVAAAELSQADGKNGVTKDGRAMSTHRQAKDLGAVKLLAWIALAVVDGLEIARLGWYWAGMKTEVVATVGTTRMMYSTATDASDTSAQFRASVES